MNLVSGLQEKKFICPIFGTTHKIENTPDPSEWFASYRGEVYSIKRIYNQVAKKVFFAINLITKNPQSPNSFIKIRVLFISDDMKTYRMFAPDGSVCWASGESLLRPD